MLRKFKSLKDDQIGYMIDTDAPWKSDFSIERTWRMFQTLGDGMIQHSADWPVTKENLGDFMYSLASFMLERFDDEELLREVAMDVLQAPKKDKIEFAASVKFKESDREYTKQRYFSIKEMKIAGRKKVEYDKRYQEIRDFHDGSANSIYRILMADREYPDGLEMLATANAIYRWAMLEDDNNKVWAPSPAELLKWFEDDREKSKEIRLGFECVLRVVESHIARERAKCDVGNYTRNLERKAEATETAA